MKEIGLEETILLPDEAVKRLQEQAVSIDFEEENQMTVTSITLEYVVITTPAGRILAAPVWRFWLGEDDDARSFFGHKILGIDAVTGELIWKENCGGLTIDISYLTIYTKCIITNSTHGAHISLCTWER